MTPLPREGRTKDVMQVLTISMYDYIRNICLHYIDELELLCITLGCECYMMNIIQHNYHHRSNAYDFLILVSTKLLCCFCFTLATNCYCYYCCYNCYYCYCYQ